MIMDMPVYYITCTNYDLIFYLEILFAG
jgi:hypothetical protein